MISAVLLLAACSLVLTQANIAFQFINGFQTKNSADRYYVTVSYTTDKGYASSVTSPYMGFDSQYNFTVTNANKYINNIKANMYLVGASSTPVTTYSSGTTSNFTSNNFFMVASTLSYDPLTGANVPKINVVTGYSDPYAITFANSDFFYSAMTSTNYYYPPASYSIYYYPYLTLKTTMTNSYVATSSGYTKFTQQTDTKSLIYASNTIATHKYCTGSACVQKDSVMYAGSGQMFATVYYGNYIYSQVGKMSIIVPPNTLEVK